MNLSYNSRIAKYNNIITDAYSHINYVFCKLNKCIYNFEKIINLYIVIIA